MILLVIFCLYATLALESNPRPTAKGIQKVTKDLLDRDWELSSAIRDVRTLLSRNDRLVPVIGMRKFRKQKDSFMELRQRLFDYGCYPGVEYRLKDIIFRNASISSVADAIALEADESEVLLLLRPAYKLIPQLERKWPVIIPLSEIPWCLSRGAYNTVTVLSSILLALSFLLASIATTFSVTFSVVNTRSMFPAIQPKDVILVEKVTPILKRALHIPIAKSGDIIYFTAPDAMNAYIALNKLPPIKSGDLLVKRVRSVSLSDSDRNRECYDVRGDNAKFSLDSRDWGCLRESEIIGSPILRVWPLNRSGKLK